MSKDNSEALQRLLDKDEVRDLMARYCRGVDRADWGLVRSTYHSDAYDDHGDYKGSIVGFIAFATSRTGGATQVMHFLGECLIEFAGRDVAVAETYFFTAHTLGSEAQRQYGAALPGRAARYSSRTMAAMPTGSNDATASGASHTASSCSRRRALRSAKSHA